ncbi:MAG: hypothetical protein KF715_12200 [Candidatus Didemnitutus sp.]|nr:hypothetical protein [Candidatus Didemnitutus sp.]
MKPLFHFALLSLAAATLPLAAPAAAPAGPPAAATVEELYRGELDDTGPQYLLQPAAGRPTRFAVWSRVDASWTDNATFTETNSGETTVSSFQLGGDVNCLERTVAAGKLRLAAGAHGQMFRYGFASDDDRVIDYLQVDRNNFDLLGTHLRATWQRGPWLAASALQGTLLHNRSAGRTFYRELAWDAALYRQWTVAGKATVLVGADLARRWSTTETYGLLPRSWNDRAEAGLTAAWQQPIRGKLAWRATARVTGTDYTHADRSRRDVTGSLGAELLYTWRERCDFRVFVSHERRDSTEPAIADYARWEAGAGAGVRWEF